MVKRTRLGVTLIRTLSFLLNSLPKQTQILPAHVSAMSADFWGTCLFLYSLLLRQRCSVSAIINLLRICLSYHTYRRVCLMYQHNTPRPFQQTRETLSDNYVPNKTDNCRAPLIIFWIITPIRITISFQRFGAKVEFVSIRTLNYQWLYHCISSHTSDWPQFLQPSHIINISSSQPLQHSLQIKSSWSWR